MNESDLHHAQIKKLRVKSNFQKAKSLMMVGGRASGITGGMRWSGRGGGVGFKSGVKLLKPPITT